VSVAAEPGAVRADARFRPMLWGIIALGVAAGTILALSTRGDPYDMESFGLVRAALDHGPLEPYALFAQQGIVRWPYPPAFFPWIWVSGALAGHGLSFAFFVRVPSILADAALAWLVQDFLGSRGVGARTRLVAAGLVALGPSFLAISGYHGQIDALAILPGVAAVSLWERRGHGASRALAAGLLVGVGGALKTVPLLLLLALLPSVRSRREALTLLAAAALPLAVAFAPFALAGKLPSVHVLTYRGLPGAGGLSLLAQPDLSLATLGISPTRLSGPSDALVRYGGLLVGAGLLAVAAVGARSRARALPLAVLLWLAVYAFGVNFFFQYALWGLPFFLMAGYVREVLVVQAVLLLPTLVYYGRPWHLPAVAIAYTAIMLLVLLASFGGFGLLAQRLLRVPSAAQSSAGAADTSSS